VWENKGGEMVDYCPYRETTCLAKIGLKIIRYDACSEKRNVPLYENLKYIGKGYIWSINGTRQHFKRKHHFWVRPQNG
jgi:hypothetical protein